MSQDHTQSDAVPPSGGPLQPPPAAPPQHTYMVQQWRMQIGSPLTFSVGERIVAVLSSEPMPLTGQIEVTMLVEVPPGRVS